MRRAAARQGRRAAWWSWLSAATGGTRSSHGRALLGSGARLLGSGGGVAVEQRRGRVQHVLGELALRGEELLDEVVRAGHKLTRLGQLVGERDANLGHRRLDGLDGVRPRLDRLDNGVLALADGLQNLTL